MCQGAKLSALGVDLMSGGQFLGYVAHAVDVGLQTVGERLQAVLEALEQLGHLRIPGDMPYPMAPNFLPPRRCMWGWTISWPESSPWLSTNR